MASGDQMNFISELGSNPMARIALDQFTSRVIPSNFDNYSTSRIFTPQLRVYFDVDTQTVSNKLRKLLFPFKTYQFDDAIKKLQLYIPIVSLMTLILFSTLLQGIGTTNFHPNIGKRTIWILLITIVEIVVAKCTENVLSNLNISIVELASLVSYRFVPISAMVVVMVLNNSLIPYLGLVGGIYVLVADGYFCKLELSNFAREHMKEEGLGSKIAVLFHVFTTLLIMWLCKVL